jgi:hypothetical protein
LGFLPEDKIHEVDVVCGAFLMTKRKLLLDMGGFDESFFMYGEDIDLNYRIKKLGYKNFYLGTEAIIHFKGESARQDVVNHTHIFYDAMNVFVTKHYKRKWIMKALLRMGIFTGKSIRLLAASAEKEKGILNDDRPKGFLLIGDPIAASEAEKILKQYFGNVQIKKLQSINSFDQQNASLHQIVFCFGNFSCGRGIEFMLISKNKFEYYWHGYHTKSMVGSNNRNSTGEAFEANFS